MPTGQSSQQTQDLHGYHVVIFHIPCNIHSSGDTCQPETQSAKHATHPRRSYTEISAEVQRVGRFELARRNSPVQHHQHALWQWCSALLSSVDCHFLAPARPTIHCQACHCNRFIALTRKVLLSAMCRAAAVCFGALKHSLLSEQDRSIVGVKHHWQPLTQLRRCHQTPAQHTVWHILLTALRALRPGP